MKAWDYLSGFSAVNRPIRQREFDVLFESYRMERQEKNGRARQRGFGQSRFKYERI